MRLSTRGLVSCVLAALVLAAPPVGAVPPPDGEEPSGVEEAGFEGVWETTFGRLVLRVADGGRSCTGAYEYAGGRIEGTIEGNVLTFTYAEQGGTVRGEGRFELSDDGSSFTGRWRQEGQREWQDWEGTRVRATADGETVGRPWLVVLESIWDGSMTQSNYSWGEMLEAWFERYPQVGFRHRTFQDPEDLNHWCAGLGMLEGPKVVLIAAHGSRDGLQPDRVPVSLDQIAAALARVPELELVHFSSCAILAGPIADRILEAYPGGHDLTVSGYEVPVDWPHSATLELLYLDYVLGQGMAPPEAADRVASQLSFAGDGPADHALHFEAVTGETGEDDRR